MKIYVLSCILIPSFIAAMDDMDTKHVSSSRRQKALSSSPMLGWIDVLKEIDAKEEALNLLPFADKPYLQSEGYSLNKEKSIAVIKHFAQLTSKILEEKGLIPFTKEIYEQKLIETMIRELASLHE